MQLCSHAFKRIPFASVAGSKNVLPNVKLNRSSVITATAKLDSQEVDGRVCRWRIGYRSNLLWSGALREMMGTQNIEGNVRARGVTLTPIATMHCEVWSPWKKVRSIQFHYENIECQILLSSLENWWPMNGLHVKISCDDPLACMRRHD